MNVNERRNRLMLYIPPKPISTGDKHEDNVTTEDEF